MQAHRKAKPYSVLWAQSHSMAHPVILHVQREEEQQNYSTGERYEQYQNCASPRAHALPIRGMF